ncbi:MAG: SLC13 family permease [Syntrophobacteraceae bacterium]|nr:anion permease [Desulfobacteraceae bacterium]
MKLRSHVLFVFLTLLTILFTPVLQAGAAENGSSGDVLIVSGTITNAHAKPVADVKIDFYVNGKKFPLKEEVSTSRMGRYEAELVLPAGTLSGAGVELEAARPSYRTTGKIALDNIVRECEVEQGKTRFLAHSSFHIERAITPAFWIATIVLFAVYTLIALEFMHRTLAALLGASIMLFVTYTLGTFNPNYVILPFEDAMRAIDMNVIFLLLAMMIIVGILKKTGVFQWTACKAYQAARGNVFVLAGILMAVTAVISAFLDNVTTMLLVIPVTIEIALTLKVSPVAFLIPEAFASNVGGTATLIGDPPNIMIGSYAKLTFMDFVQNLTVVNIIGLAVIILYFAWWYRKEYRQAHVENVQKTIAHLKETYTITDRSLLIKGLIVLGLTIFLFIIHGALNMEPSIAALFGATVLMVISKIDIVEMLEHEIEWPTLIFFMMLFVVVAGAEETGLIQVIAEWVKNMSKGSLVIAVLMILWVSALASAIIDNIPFTATMLPIVAYLTTEIPGAECGVLWWALSLGACLGGNGTMIGASANVVTVGMAERAGYSISFMDYLKAAFIPMLITIVICSAWLLLVEM